MHLQNAQSLERARSEVLTASDSSMGSSGGTTDVRMSVHSRNNLYLFRDGFLLPVVGHFIIDYDFKIYNKSLISII